MSSSAKNTVKLQIRLWAVLVLVGTSFVFGLPSAWALADSASQYYTPELEQKIQSTSDSEQVKNLLFDLLKSTHVPVEYDRARVFIFFEFYPTKASSPNMVRDVYCEQEYRVPAKRGDFPDGNVVNVEHTWPQSRFTMNFPKDTQKGDAHHLFPADSQMNSDRGSYPFGEVAKDRKRLKCDIGRLGSAEGSGNTVFEPPRNHKGNVARALFYFAVRYHMRIDDGQEAFLRRWNQEDPVDQEERDRNEAIFQLQKNRNPFIDHNEWVDKIKDF